MPRTPEEPRKHGGRRPNSGRKRVVAYCSKCGAKCDGARVAREHCR